MMSLLIPSSNPYSVTTSCPHTAATPCNICLYTHALTRVSLLATKTQNLSDDRL